MPRSQAQGTSAGKYQVIHKYVLGGDGGWDYLTLDAGARRLYIARATRVMVVDPDSGKLLGEIADTPGVHGIALVPELRERFSDVVDRRGKGFISCGRANNVAIFDMKTLATTAHAKTGDGPDAITYDPASGRIFAFNGRSQDATAIDANSGNPVGTISLGGKPEFAVADGTGRVYVNIESTSEIAVLDARKLTVLNRWPLKPCEEPTGLAIDVKTHRLFSGCSNKLMAIVDAESGKLISTLPIGAGVDATGFDPGNQIAFSSNGDGTLTLIHQDSPDRYSVLENVETARGARTSAFDPQTHNIYLVTAQFGPTSAPSAEQPRPRASIMPDSFTLLVVGRR
ncbi:MAG TPA: YncE family protein [Terriglobales bacterium]|nr:YncE family protein [Terriglobales bacterium]